MKGLVRPIALASFAVVVALPALAGLAPSEPRPAARIEMAEANPSAADHTAYLQKAREELQVWRVKLDDFGARAKTDSIEARKAAADDLNTAWAKAKEASAKLETAGDADWESAKASFQKASDELAATWKKARADVK
jgi:uncharacterized membrane protein